MISTLQYGSMVREHLLQVLLAESYEAVIFPASLVDRGLELEAVVLSKTGLTGAGTFSQPQCWITIWRLLVLFDLRVIFVFRAFSTDFRSFWSSLKDAGSSAEISMTSVSELHQDDIESSGCCLESSLNGQSCCSLKAVS